MNKLKTRYHESLTIDSEPKSKDASNQDGKDTEEKEVKTYKKVYKDLIKGCYPQNTSKADKSVRKLAKSFINILILVWQNLLHHFLNKEIITYMIEDTRDKHKDSKYTRTFCMVQNILGRYNIAWDILHEDAIFREIQIIL